MIRTLYRSPVDERNHSELQAIPSGSEATFPSSLFPQKSLASAQAPRRCLGYSLVILSLVSSGCAAWLPSGEQPPPIIKGIRTPSLPTESVAIETILLRLAPDQASQLDDLWALIDEQIVSPDLRIRLDKNGLRIGKISGGLPSLLETWLREIEEKQDGDTLETTGLASDLANRSMHWRCRADVEKEINIRNVAEPNVTLFYHDEVPKGKSLNSPRFFFTMTAMPASQAAAKLKLTPAVEFGELKSRVIVRDAALRPVSQREKIQFDDLQLQWVLNQGDCVVLGPSSDMRSLGAEFFQSQTIDHEREPILLLVRFSQSGSDGIFSKSPGEKTAE